MKVGKTALPGELRHLTQAITGIPDSAMTCAECRAWLPAYIEAEVGDLAAGQRYPQVKRHLDLCPRCEAEYLAALELALAEDRGEIPMPEQVPTPDLAFLPPLSLPHYVRSLAEKLIIAIRPSLLADFKVISPVFFERIAALGQRFTLEPGFAPAMGFGDGEAPEALQLLAATYAATQAVSETLSSQAIATLARAGQWQETIRQQAEAAARQIGLQPHEARIFAEQYAQLVAPETLQKLAERST